MSGLSLNEVIFAKTELEEIGFGVRIDETTAAADSGTTRLTIPEAVRHQVWRRDQGALR